MEDIGIARGLKEVILKFRLKVRKIAQI